MYIISSKCLIFIAVDKWYILSRDEIGDFIFVQNMILQNCKRRKYGMIIKEISFRGFKLFQGQYDVPYTSTRQLMIVYPSANKRTNKTK